jgi:hypothetical protein
VNNSAYKSAQATAKDNGFADGVNGVTVTVNIPPQSGPYQGLAGYAEAIVRMQQQRFFSNLFGRGNLPVVARAVGRGTKRPKSNGIIVLSPKGSNQLATSNTANIIVNGGNIIVDSTDPKGATISNAGNIQSDNFYFTGSPGYYSSGSGQFIGTITSSQAATPDPLINLPPPDQPVASYSNVNISGLPTANGNVPGFPTPGDPNGWTLPPGTYNNGIHISDNIASHTYTLQTGIYYFTGGGLTLSGNAAIIGDPNGVLLYFNNGGGLNITAGGPVTLSPLQSGPYANITIYEARGNTSQNSITGQATGSLNITGTVYLPSAKITVTGSGGNYAVGSQYIVYQMTATGSGNININCSIPNIPPNRNLYLVE